VKLVLVKDVPSLGKMGDVKDVANGYARNYLLPQGLAVEATAGQLKIIQDQRTAESRRQERLQAQNETLSTRLGGVTVTLKAKVGDQDRLYGSITAKDLADAVKKQAKIEIDRHKIELPEPIRTLGTHQVAVHIAGDLHPKFTVVIEEA
jgi:large subunit ribosomal protein L9